MRRRKLDKGFTLVELIIALAVLAFLMTAVSSFMGSSLLNTRKTKADLKVSASAQLVYNEITDCLMQATNVVIIGRRGASCTANDFEESGKTISGDAGDRVYIVSDYDAAANLYKYKGIYGYDADGPDGNGSDIKINPSAKKIGSNGLRFEELSKAENIYIEELIIETSVPLDLTNCTGTFTAGEGKKTVHNNLTDTDDVLYMSLSAGGKQTFSKDFDETKPLPNGVSINDTCIHRFVFRENNLYYGKRYVYMDKMNDILVMDGAAENRDNHVFSDEFGYVDYGSGVTISGLRVNVDAKVGQMDVGLYYCSSETNSGNYTYKSDGVVNVRNSKVLRDGYTTYKGKEAKVESGEGGESGGGGEGGESGGSGESSGESSGGDSSGESSGE